MIYIGPIAMYIWLPPCRDTQHVIVWKKNLSLLHERRTMKINLRQPYKKDFYWMLSKYFIQTFFPVNIIATLFLGWSFVLKTISLIYGSGRRCLHQTVYVWILCSVAACRDLVAGLLFSVTDLSIWKSILTINHRSWCSKIV